MKRRGWVLLLPALIVATWMLLPTSQAHLKLPQTTTLFGTLVDLSCAARGIAMRDSWSYATENDHVGEEGTVKQCATTGLRNGNPAALFNGKKLTAVFACNPRTTLADYAAQKVDVQGFWAGFKKDDVKSFVPRKIRRQGAKNWDDVECQYLHE